MRTQVSVTASPTSRLAGSRREGVVGQLPVSCTGLQLTYTGDGETAETNEQSMRGSNAAAHYSAPPGGRRQFVADEDANKLVQSSRAAALRHPGHADGYFFVFYLSPED